MLRGFLSKMFPTLRSCRILIALTTLLLGTSVGFASAIVPGFNATSDGRNDDGTYETGGCSNNTDGGFCAGTPVPLGFSFNFFGSTKTEVYINTNGNVTFDFPLASSTPFGLNDGFSQIIAPFFADVDTRDPASGVVTFGSGTFDGYNAFGVNWIGVGYGLSHADKLNNFQLLLVDRPDSAPGDFDIVFNYGAMEWESGDSSFGIDGLGGFSAVVGFSDGTGDPSHTLELPGSGISGSFLDGGPNALQTNRLNSDVDGRYIFYARDGVITTISPEPSTTILFAAGLVLLLAFRRKFSPARAKR